MKETIIRCPVCNKVVAIEGPTKKEKIEPVNGICWSDIGFSKGGWGSRENFIQSFSREVCISCFDQLSEKIVDLRNVYSSLKNSNYNSVTVNVFGLGEVPLLEH